jgi:hypothetical protein
MAAIAAGDNLDLHPMPLEATPSPNTLGNALSALEFHSIAAIFILAAGSEHVIRNCDRTRFQ